MLNGLSYWKVTKISGWWKKIVNKQRNGCCNVDACLLITVRFCLKKWWYLHMWYSLIYWMHWYTSFQFIFSCIWWFIFRYLNKIISVQYFLGSHKLNIIITFLLYLEIDFIWQLVCDNLKKLAENVINVIF